MNEASSADTAARDADATPGALLKRERERAALSVQQAAEDLHLDPWIIEAIESNRFVALGAPVYARGHLRKYAERLGVAVDDILARYESLQDRPHQADPIPTAVATPVRAPRRSLKGPVLVSLAVILIGALAYVGIELFLNSPESALEVSTASSAPESEPAAVVPESQDSQPRIAEPDPATLATPTEDETLRSAAPQPVTGTADETAPQPSRVAASNAPSVSMRLEFTDESWAEVYDANGTRLLFGMGTPQRVRTLTGTPPIQVTLGAASAVNLQVNGESVVIPRRDGRESARFTIDADGNLR